MISAWIFWSWRFAGARITKEEVMRRNEVKECRHIDLHRDASIEALSLLG